MGMVEHNVKGTCGCGQVFRTNTEARAHVLTTKHNVEVKGTLRFRDVIPARLAL